MNAPLDISANSVDVSGAFSRCSDAARNMAQTTCEQRIALIQSLIKTLLKYRKEVNETGLQERGLSAPDMDGEIVMLKCEADFIAQNLEQWMADEVAPPSLMTLGKKCYVRREAKGRVLVLPSWNAPYVIGLLPTLGALAAGNSVIIKPSELSSHSSSLLKKIVEEALPNGEVQVLEGGAEAAQALLAQPFNHIFYIGNNTVGRIVMKAAADHFASVTLEMGGKNPSIVAASADPEDAALKTAWGRICNAGQVCVAPDYVMVHRSHVDRFKQALLAEIQRMYNPEGKGFETNPEYPRIINDRHFQRVRGLIEDAKQKGATFLCGGEMIESQRYVAPTVVTDVSQDMKLMQEEIFGPMIAIIPFDTNEEVIERIRTFAKPLSTYIFAKDRAEIDYFISNTTSGNMAINHNVIQSGTNPHLPFGGVNASGIGRMGGWHTFNEASNARAIVEEGPPVVPPSSVMPPLTAKYKKQLNQLIEGKPVPPAMVKAINGIVKFVGLFK